MMRNLLLLSTIVTLMIGFWAAPALSAWQPPEVLGTGDKPQLALDGKGKAIAVWEASPHIYFSHWDGTAWSDAQPMANAPGALAAADPQVAYDQSGSAIVAWAAGFSDGSGRIYASRLDGTQWLEPVLLSGSEATGRAEYPQVVLNGQGKALLAWVQRISGEDDHIAAAHWDGETWTTPQSIHDGSVGSSPTSPRIAYDASGHAVAVWRQEDGHWYRIYANHWNGTAWSGAVQVSPQDTDSEDPQIAMDGSSRAVAVWRQSERIWAGHWDGEEWSTAVRIDQIEYVANDPQIAFDASGAAVAVWRQVDQSGFADSIQTNRWAQGAWGAAEDISAPSNWGVAHPQIALDGAGTAVAVWGQRQSDGGDYHVLANHRHGSAWSGAMRLSDNEPVWDPPRVGSDSSGAVIALWRQQGEIHAAATTFSGGDGSVDHPYRIATPAQLDAVRDYLDAHFIVTSDIDLDIAPYNEGEGWAPIGTYVNWESPANTPFTGRFDGGGHTIANLFIDRPEQQDVGLFGLTDGAHLANLTLADVAIAGRTAGALVGWAFATTISDVATSGEVIALTRAGGLVGEVFTGSTITDSGASCTVSTTNGTNAGGLIGQMRGTRIERSFATGEVSAGSQDLAGGLVGEARAESTIIDSYATGAVSGADEVGGLIGYLNNSVIEKSWATGRTEGTRRVGGLVGYTFNDVLIAASHASGAVQGFGDVGGLVGDLQGIVERSFAVGEVVADNRAGGLVGFAQSGSSITTSHAAGTVSGAVSLGGLVGRTDGLVSLSFAVGTVHGAGSSVGGLVGDLYNTGARVENSYARGAVYGDSYVGGLVGSAYESSIVNAYATGAVSGSDEVGGLVGELSGATVTTSYYDSTINGEDVAAGKGEPKTTAEMRQQSTFAGWDFAGPWKIADGATYPFLRWQKYFFLDGVHLHLVEDAGEVKTGFVMTIRGADAPTTRVQSTISGDTELEGIDGQWLVVTRAAAGEVRAVAVSGDDGESRTWFEIRDQDTWQESSATLAPGFSFEAGSEIVIEEGGDGLQIRIETTVTRDIHF